MATRAKALGFGVILLFAGALGGVVYARRVASRRAARERGDLVLHVPHRGGAITIDGETADPGWILQPVPARTGEFVLENGKPARPHSNARLVWDEEYLYLAVLASDEDIRSDDGMRFAFSQGDTEQAIDVSPKGAVTGSIRDVRAVGDVDGIMDNPKGFDEEWNLEIAIPLASLGMKGQRGESVGMALSRCDTPKDGVRVCAGWGDAHDPRGRGRIVLD